MIISRHHHHHRSFQSSQLVSDCLSVGLSAMVGRWVGWLNGQWLSGCSMSHFVYFIRTTLSVIVAGENEREQMVVRERMERSSVISKVYSE